MKVLKIGRASDNDVVISDKQVSGQHLLISQNEEGLFYAQDLNSTNGTFINGKKISIEPVALAYNDVIKIGETLLPWRDYFKTEETSSDKPIENNSEEYTLSAEAKSQISYRANNRTLTWGLSLVLLIFFILLLVWYFTNVISPELSQSYFFSKILSLLIKK